jgi:FkbM family methyltransferase
MTIPKRLVLARKICRRLPPIISQRIRTVLYSFDLAKRDNYEFIARSQTGSKLRCQTKDFHGYPFSVHGYFEWRNIAIAIALASEGDVIVEIGANVGTETVGFSDIVGETGKVYAFEPLPSNIKVLHDLMKLSTYRNIKVYPYALSDRNQTLKFVVPPEYSSGTGHICHKKVDDNIKTIDVDCISFDSISKQINKATLIFIDAEGEEIRILRGARTYIRHFKPFIVLEASPMLLHRNGFSPKELYNEINNFGYIPYKISRFGVKKVESLEFSDACNLICIDTKRQNIVNRIRKHILACALLPCIQGLNPMSRV